MNDNFCPSIIRPGDDQPEKHVGEETGDATGEEGNEKSQPEPESAYAVKFRQAAANTGNDTVTLGAAKWTACSCIHRVFSNHQYYQYIR
jgi:hypothetical protein